jgi:WD40 repeat protein
MKLLPVGTLPPPATLINLSPDGRWLLTAADDQTHLWEARTLHPITALDGRLAPGAFSPDGRHLAVYRQTTQRMNVLTLPRLEAVQQINPINLFFNQEVAYPDRIDISLLQFYGETLYLHIEPRYNHSDADDRHERMKQDGSALCVVQDALSQVTLKTFAQARSQGLSHDGRYWFLRSHFGRDTSLYDTQSWRRIFTTKATIRECAINSHHLLYLSSSAGSAQRRLVSLPVGKEVRAVDTPDGFIFRRKALFSAPGSLYFWDAENRQLYNDVAGATVAAFDQFPARDVLALSPNGRIAAGIDGANLYIRDLETGVEIQPDEAVTAAGRLDFSPNSNYLYVSTASNGIAVYAIVI